MAPNTDEMEPTRNRDLKTQDDAQLVLALVNRLEAALAELYARHGSALYALARRVLVDDSEAKDVVQEVFVRLWSSPERYEPARGSLRAFLMAQAHARAVDVVRSVEARRKREHREGIALQAAYDVAHEASDLILAEQAARALAVLPDDERLAVELAYYEGLTYVEVARALGEPEGTIKARIRRAMGRMRNALEENGFRGAHA